MRGDDVSEMRQDEAEDAEPERTAKTSYTNARRNTREDGPVEGGGS
jgi:hypothetical protein